MASGQQGAAGCKGAVNASTAGAATRDSQIKNPRMDIGPPLARDSTTRWTPPVGAVCRRRSCVLTRPTSLSRPHFLFVSPHYLRTQAELQHRFQRIASLLSEHDSFFRFRAVLPAFVPLSLRFTSLHLHCTSAFVLLCPWMARLTCHHPSTAISHHHHQARYERFGMSLALPPWLMAVGSDCAQSPLPQSLPPTTAHLQVLGARDSLARSATGALGRARGPKSTKRGGRQHG